MNKCKCKTEEGWCQSDAVGTLKLPVPPGELVDTKTGEANAETEWCDLPVCAGHVREALHDFTPGKDSDRMQMELTVTPEHITLTFGNLVAYQVPNVHGKEGEEAAAEFMAGLEELGYEIKGVTAHPVN